MMWGYVVSGLLSFISVTTVIVVALLHHAGQLRFSHGELLPLLLLIPVTIGLLYLKERRRKAMLAKLGKEELIRGLIPQAPGGLTLLSATALSSAVLFAVLAMLGPQMGTKMETVHRRGVDIFLAVDTSKSMDADDIKPSRIERAKLQIQDFVDQIEGDRLGLIAFAGDAFVQCPLTLDYGAVKIFLDVLDTSLIPSQGTNLGAAIERALEGFSKKERKYKVLILFTDGEDHGESGEKMAKRASEEGVVIYTVGIGSPGGSVIPEKDAGGDVIGYKKDREGKVVTSRLDETILQKIALETGGRYDRSTTGEMELKRIYREIQKMEKKELGSQEITRFEDRYQLFLTPSFIFFFIAALFTLPLWLRRRDA